MAYCAMNGVEVKIPERALRPREPAPPLPSVTMASPLVARRMLRPRTKAETSLVGVDVKKCLELVRELKQQQRKYEERLAVLVERLKHKASSMEPKARKKVQSDIDSLLKCIEQIAAKANEAAMAAIKGGASQEDVRAAAGESRIERTPVAAPPAAPVIETRTPAVLPDGSVIPGPDAKLTTPETGKPVAPEKDKAETASKDEGGLGLVHLALIAGGTWFLWSRLRRA
jgi:hypothetical protein